MKKSTKDMLIASLTTARTSVVQVAKKYAKTIVASTVTMASVLAPVVTTSNHWITPANVAHTETSYVTEEEKRTSIKNAIIAYIAEWLKDNQDIYHGKYLGQNLSVDWEYDNK